jgi:membrane associated rhomboid family serine protease
MIPISDDKPPRSFPVVNLLLVAVCITTFVFIARDPSALTKSIVAFGLVPRNIFGWTTRTSAGTIAAPLTFFTSVFIHAGWLHLLGNMLYLWVFGNNVEDALGHLRYLFFFAACAVAAAMTHALLYPGSSVPVVGASGAVAGVLGGYLRFFPRARVRTILFFNIFVYITTLPAVALLVIWFALQVVGVQAGRAIPGAAQVAWAAHLGGFATGLVLSLVMARTSAKRAPLKGRKRVSAKAG